MAQLGQDIDYAGSDLTLVLEPVMISQVKTCAWRAKPCGTCGRPQSNKIHRKETGSCTFKKQLRCARCDLPKSHPDHYGAPPSMNILGLGKPRVYQNLKETWEALLAGLLRESDLPRGLASVMVEGEVSFGDEDERDQGNHRMIVEKALGDALEAGEWIPNDSWDHYQFNGFRRIEEPGVSRLRLILFPSTLLIPR